MFKMWEIVDYVVFDPRVNRGYGDGQWCIQECFEILIRRTIERIIEGEESLEKR